MEKPIKKKTLEELPVFKGAWEVLRTDKPAPHIFEIAILTSKEIPDTDPVYKIQYHGGVIGRDKDAGEIYFAEKTMKREDGIFLYGNVEGIKVDNLESYFIPSENSFRELTL